MKHIIETENFFVCIEPEIFEADINLSTNTILKIDVKSNGFTASTTMDIDIKDLAKLGKDLCQIYETLQGNARLEEPYGQHMYMSFVGNNRGHIAIKGYLHKGNRTGSEQVLEFQNDVDQTCLRQFYLELLSNYEKYL